MEVADCRRLEELSKKITNFSNQLEEKNIQIGDLKRKGILLSRLAFISLVTPATVINLKSQLAQHASDKNDHSGGDSSFFEKKLAKRLLLSILSGTKISDTKMDAAEKLASVLDFDSNETASIGLPSKQIEFSDTGNPPTIRRVSGPGTPAGGIDQSDNVGILYFYAFSAVPDLQVQPS